MKIRQSTIVISAIFLLAILVRIPGLFTEFWGDEIWSWSIAGQLHSISGILLAAPARIDNNHPLNTLWLYLCGPHAAVWWYRFPSFLAGIASVGVAVHIMRRRSGIAAIAAAVLIGFSYPLVFYSSEARGYAPAVFFGLLAFDAIEIALTTGSGVAQFAFGVAASLGFLSHLTFLHVYVAAFVWSVFVAGEGEGAKARRGEERREEEKSLGANALANSPVFFASSFAPSRLRALPRFRLLIRLHALPLAIACLLYALFIKHMVIGGAAPTDPTHVILWTLSLALGGPNAGVGCVVVAAIAFGMFILALLLNRNRQHDWIFFAVAVIGSPAITTIRELAFSDHPQPLMVRYFLVCLAMLLLGLCPMIGELWGRSTAMRLVIITAGFGYFIGNGVQLGEFWKLGRGHTGAALARMVSAQPSGPIELASDNVPRTRMLLSFYVPRLSPSRQVDLRANAAEWLVLNRNEPTGDRTLDFDGSNYRLDSVYRSGPLSGWSWLLYRRNR